MWGNYPVLRKALEDKPIPDSLYGPTSISDNMLDVMVRLSTIATLISEYPQDVINIAQSSGDGPMYHDLNRVEQELNSMASIFTRAARDIHALYSRLDEVRER
jgi:hypothetical protein